MAAVLPGAVAVDCTKLAPMTILMSSAAAAQVRSRYRLEAMAFMGISLDSLMLWGSLSLGGGGLNAALHGVVLY
jgi:hypothetical protein